MGFNDLELELPYGASAGYRFELFLKQFIGLGASTSNLNFDELPTPYRGTATDLETGELKVFDSGDLAKVMRASMSLPAIVAPTVIDDHVYVDGGLIRNLPIDIGRETCGEIIIAVNLGTTPKSRDEIRNIIDVASQAVILLTEQNVNASLQELSDRDVLITPDLTGFGTYSFDSGLQIIERGEQAAWANREALVQLSVTEEEYEEWLNTRKNRIPDAPLITSIAVTTDGAINSEAVEKDITVEAGDDFNVNLLGTDLLDMYGRGDFSYVSYAIVPDEDNATVIIDARSKPWGPGYLKFGLGVASDLESPTQFNLAASYRRTWINALGAEWRADAQLGYDSFLVTEFTQPLQVRDGAFITPYIGIRRLPVQVYEQDLRLGAVDTRRLQGGFNIGITGKTGELKLGPYAGRVRTKNDFGIATPVLPEFDMQQVGLVLSGVYDQLDSLSFPRSGVSATLDVRATRKAWGSEDQFTRARIKLIGVKSFGKHTIAGQLEWGDQLSDNDTLPIYESFNLGGPRRLSGLYLDQLTGSRYDLATLNY
jgi:NTE family protein